MNVRREITHEPILLQQRGMALTIAFTEFLMLMDLYREDKMGFNSDFYGFKSILTPSPQKKKNPKNQKVMTLQSEKDCCYRVAIYLMNKVCTSMITF